MKLFLTIVFNFFLCTILAQSSKLDLYVDPVRGNDKNDGSQISRSFKTINKAQDKIRNINRLKYHTITIFLRDGFYSLNKTLLFNEFDGGNKACKIIYKNSNYSPPLLTFLRGNVQ